MDLQITGACHKRTTCTLRMNNNLNNLEVNFVFHVKYFDENNSKAIRVLP